MIVLWVYLAIGSVFGACVSWALIEGMKAGGEAQAEVDRITEGMADQGKRPAVLGYAALATVTWPILIGFMIKRRMGR